MFINWLELRNIGLYLRARYRKVWCFNKNKEIVLNTYNIGMNGRFILGFPRIS